MPFSCNTWAIKTATVERGKRTQISRRAVLQGLALSSAGAAGLAACSREAPQLSLAIWQDYLGETTLTDFRRASGIDVTVTTYADNAQLYAKLKAGGHGFDLVVPSSQWAERLIREDLLAPISHGRLPNLANLEPAFAYLPYDPGNAHSVPYTWLALGIGYRKSKVARAPGGWKELLEGPGQAGRIALPIPILIVCAAWFTRRVHGYYAEIRKSVADLNAYLQDALSGIKETIGFNQHEYERERFETLSQTYSQNSLRAMFLWSWYWPGMVFVGSTGTVLILWYGAGEVLAGELTVGQLVMFLSYLGLFYTPINEIHSLNHMLQHALAASERVFEILDTKTEVEDRPGAVRPVERLRGAVEYRHVGFGYRKDGTVLSDVNLTVRPGERIALVGPSGAGKTSLLKLLMRFYDVRSGAVLVDGHDVRELPLDFLRGQIGLVQQEPFLFNGTVRQNIVYSDLSAGHERVEAAARAARAHDFITRLPDGYDSWIGERGVKLSVGQKQRVSIARVLLKDPPIVIFDEATSNIDTETEVKIREALNDLTKGRTTFIIAHRLATLHDVDRIIVVERGTIVEEGDHEALMKRGGVYAGLYEAQFKI